MGCFMLKLTLLFALAGLCLLFFLDIESNKKNKARPDEPVRTGPPG